MAKLVKTVSSRNDEPTVQSEVRKCFDWKLCMLCQTESNEHLVCTANSKRKDVGAGYKSLSLTLSQLHELNVKPFDIDICELDNGEGIVPTLNINKACWHKSCRNKINSTEIKRVAKRKAESEEGCSCKPSPVKTRRSSGDAANKGSDSHCLFCDKSEGDLHEASTKQLDEKVRKYATELRDTNLLAKLAAGSDMVAIDAVYHTKCIVAFYNRARRLYSETEDNKENRRQHAMAFAELVSYLEDFREIENTLPVFTLADLSKLYSSILKNLGAEQQSRVHTTRLREKLEAELPDLVSYKRGRDIHLAFDRHMGDIMKVACERDDDSEALQLARAAHIIRRDIFDHKNSLFNGSFHDNCQSDSVPSSLKALVNMILEGPCSNTESVDNISTSSISIAISQLIGFNCVKRRRTIASDEGNRVVRHNKERETPLPLFIGLKIHGETRSKTLIDTFNKMGLSISYDRVLSISTDVSNSVCSRFEEDGVVCPPRLRQDLFTTGALDNIDHNPSATTAKDSFHGTAISLVQHPTNENPGNERSQPVISENVPRQKTVKELPDSYRNVPPATLKTKDQIVPKLIGSVVPDTNRNAPFSNEIAWLTKVKSLYGKDELTDNDFISWAALHASLRPPPTHQIALLPLFLESAHTVAMVRHGMTVVKDVIQHINPGQTPVIAMDQPLFALAKQIQWGMPETHGEDLFVVMFGALHIEMAAFKTLGELLDGSGWVSALVNAEIATPGTAESFLKASHLARTRHAHQVTAAALFILMKSAYEKYTGTLPTPCVPLDFKAWHEKMVSDQPQFFFWSQVLELEVLVLEIVQALREGNFLSYVQSVAALVPLMFALNHTNYARWLPVHVRDMASLERNHPTVYLKFLSGAFVVNKTKNPFSSIALDHAHEQENASIKGEGCAVGLTENLSALRRWMIGGPETTFCTLQCGFVFRRQ